MWASLIWGRWKSLRRRPTETKPKAYQGVKCSQRIERMAPRPRCARGPAPLLLFHNKAPESPAEEIMAWTTPTLVEICIGLEINGYLPAEF